MALTEIKTSGIADDAVTTDKLANAINTERTANTAKPSLANDANNRVVTGDGSGGLNGEANLTFDGNNLKVTAGSEGYSASIQLIADEGDDAADNWRLLSNASDNALTVSSSESTERLRIKSDGGVEIKDGDLVIEAAGHGINFHPHSGTDNLLDDYEEGTWTPTATAGTFAVANGTYTKIGRLVTAFFVIEVHSTTSSNYMQFNGLPFINAGNSGENMSSIAYNETGNVMRIYVNGSGVAGLFWNDNTSFFTYANCSGDRIRGGVSYFAST